MKLKISAKELRALGYPESPVIPVAMNVMEKHFKHHTKEEALDILKAVLQSPADYATHETLQSITEKLLPKVSPTGGDSEGASPRLILIDQPIC